MIELDYQSMFCMGLNWEVSKSSPGLIEIGSQFFYGSPNTASVLQKMGLLLIGFSIKIME